jgi:hypothetical protein
MMIKIICPKDRCKEVYEWFNKTNKEEMTCLSYPDGMYSIKKKDYGFLVDSIDGETFEVTRDLPAPDSIFRGLNKAFPFVGIEGYISHFDFRCDIDYSVHILSLPGETILKNLPLTEEERED